MSLSNILLDVAADLGLDITDDNERNLAIVRVNQAAKELYDGNDLIGSLREKVFDPNTSTQQVALPYYVDKIRGMRYYEGSSRGRITLQDIRSRYNNGIGNEVWYLRWRLLHTNYPLQRNIENEAPLILNIPQPEVDCFTVTVIGTTPTGVRVNEIVKFCPGEITHTTNNSWLEIESIKKSDVTAGDLTILDVDNNQLSFIPNICKTPRFTIIQVLDFEMTTNLSVEILYKLRYMPFILDDDEFTTGDSSYDKCIYWKYREHEFSRNMDTEGALASHAKCNEVITQIKENNEAGTAKGLNHFPNAYFNSFPSLISPWGNPSHRYKH